jgi:WD40 repeat protein
MLQAHKYTAAAVVGSDAGHCAVFDARSGQLEWLWHGDVPSIADVALVPSPDLCSIVVAATDGQLLLLDMRRSGQTAVLAKVADDAALSCVETDGNSAIAGSANGGLLVWNLDPAAEQTARDTELGIPCTGAGLAFKVPLATSAVGAVTCLSIDGCDDKWLIAAGHEDGVISINELSVIG